MAMGPADEQGAAEDGTRWQDRPGYRSVWRKDCDCQSREYGQAIATAGALHARSSTEDKGTKQVYTLRYVAGPVCNVCGLAWELETQEVLGDRGEATDDAQDG